MEGVGPIAVRDFACASIGPVMGLPVQNVSASSSWHRWFPAILVIGSVASIYWGWLALPVGFGCFVAAVTLDSLRRHRAPRAGLCVLFAALLVSGGLARFVIVEGMSGIVRGGRQAVQRKAVSKLREILFAQDAMRRSGWIDSDSDGVGSAPLLEELCSGQSHRGKARGQAPVLRCSRRLDSAIGKVIVEGAYRYVVCLPRKPRGWTARDGDELDEERAESHFIAYAWPAPGSGFDAAFFIDEQENILTRSVLNQVNRGNSVSQQGFWGPTCDSAVEGDEVSLWKIWRGKKPRAQVR